MKPYLPYQLLLIVLFALSSCSSDSEDPSPEPDTTAPTVSFSIAGASGSGPVIVSGQIEITINAQDSNGIAKVEAFIDDQKVGEDTTAPFNIIVDLSGYASKSSSAKSQNYTLSVIATDTSGNTTSKEQVITIISETELIKINLPDEYMNPNLIEFYVFASTMEGELLGFKKINQNDSSVTISTEREISENELFMLTFAKLNNFDVAQFTTITNLSTNLLPEINLAIDQRFELRSANQIFQATGFDSLSDFTLSVVGRPYIGNIDYTDYNTIQIDRYECTNCENASSDYIYLSLLDSDVPFKYLVTPWNIDENYIFSLGDFITEGLQNNTISIDNVLNQPIEFAYFRLQGYFDGVDFENNFYHLIDDKATSSLINDEIPYVFNNIFEKYTYEVTVNRYYTNRNTIPPSSITPLNWNINYSISERTISIEKNGTDDILGKIILGTRSDNENYIPYSWELIYDSQQTNQVKLPDFPEEIKSWQFYEDFSNQTLQVRQVEIKKYENLVDFDDYITKIIANNRRPFSISNEIESIFINNESSFHGTLDGWLVD